MGKWDNKASAFVERFKLDLRDKKTAYFFLSRDVAENDPEKNGKNRRISFEREGDGNSGCRRAFLPGDWILPGFLFLETYL
jgi:hypothetical protein